MTEQQTPKTTARDFLISVLIAGAIVGTMSGLAAFLCWRIIG